jgi:hypothetical protein
MKSNPGYIEKIMHFSLQILFCLGHDVFTLFTDSGYNVYNAAGLSAPNQ